MPINLKTPALALLLASTGCVAPPIDDPDVEERVDGAHEALTQPDGGDASPSLADLPRWKVFLRGTDIYHGTTRVDYGEEHYFDDPRDADRSGGFVPALGERKETFKCEGEVFHGYRRGCADFQAKATGAKWGEKLSGWEGRYFSANNIAMTHEDWTTVCKVMSTIAYTTGCAAIYFSCAAGTFFTVGTLAIPCAALIFVACTAGGAAETVLFDRCGTLMKMR